MVFLRENKSKNQKKFKYFWKGFELPSPFQDKIECRFYLCQKA